MSDAGFEWEGFGLKSFRNDKSLDVCVCVCAPRVSPVGGSTSINQSGSVQRVSAQLAYPSHANDGEEGWTVVSRRKHARQRHPSTTYIGRRQYQVGGRNQSWNHPTKPQTIQKTVQRQGTRWKFQVGCTATPWNLISKSGR